MSIYIFIYLLLLPGILYDNNKNKLANKQKWLLFYILIFTLFRGLRWNTGTDWDQYLYHFENLNINNIFSYSRYGGEETLEPLYAFINVFIGFFGDYTLFLIATNLFILYTYYYVSIKYTPKPIITFALVLLCANFFPLRLELAATVLMWTIPAIINQNLKKFIIVTVIAFFIHKSAIVFLPFYWILQYKLKLPIQIALYTACSFLINETMIRSIILGMALIMPISSVQDAAQNYLNATFDYGLSSVVSGMTSYIMAVVFLILMHLYTKKREETILYTISVNAYLYMSCISQVIPESIGDLGRIGGFFIWGLPIAFSFLMDFLFRTKFKYITLIIFILYCVYKFIRLCGLFPEALFPYYSIFNSPPYVR